MQARRLDVRQIADVARRLRHASLVMTSEAGSGHPTSCLSCADIVAVLFFHEMTWFPGDPFHPEMDAFVLSKGHAAPVWYAALHEAGALRLDLKTLRRFDSPLEGHPTPRLEWCRVATGSLGQGLSAACGMALARKMSGRASRVYVLLGDGECAEGAVWEAAEFAAHRRLDNLCAVLDVNALGQSGPTMHGHDTAALATRFRAFGWNALEADGHDIEALVAAFAAARAHTGAPTVIVARTIKGKGVSFLEGKDGWHGKPVPKGPELEQALREIAAPEPVGTRAIPTRRITKWETRGWLRWTPSYRKGDSVATREAYGTALARLAQFHPDVVVLDGDVKNSTFAEKFLAAAPERYVECYIAEQNMVGVALGLAAEGKIPFVSSFACFLTRAADFLRMGAYSRPRRLILCGSHAGVSIGQDGPSQMGLEDLALFRSLFDSTVLYPCDAVSTERCVQTAIDAKGIVYIRTTRPKTPVLYDNEELFPRGGSKTLRQSPRDRAAIIAAGITVFEALEAADRLAADGVCVRVIDAYCVQPLDAETIRRAARETGRVVVVEDHNPAGGLGEAVAAAVAGLAPVHHLCVRQMPRSGTPRELMRHQGIDADAIMKAVRSER